MLGENDPDYATQATRKFDEAGEWTFYCSVHFPSMSGTVTVEPGGGAAGPASGVAKTEYRVDGGGRPLPLVAVGGRGRAAPAPPPSLK